MAYNYEYPYTDPSRYNDDWVLQTVKDVLSQVESFTEWKAQHEAEYLQLKALYDDIIAGRFPEEISKAFEDWMRKNALDLVGKLVISVYFGLTEAGYFVAYIPESWQDIIFNTTGLDISLSLMPDYGHLVLSY